MAFRAPSSVSAFLSATSLPPANAEPASSRATAAALHVSFISFSPLSRVGQLQDPDSARIYSSGTLRVRQREVAGIWSCCHRLFFGCGRLRSRMLDVGCRMLGALDRFYADNFGIWRVFGALDGGRLALVLILTLGLASLGEAAGAAAAELLGGAQDGAIQAGFVALEAGQDAFRAAVGVGLGDEGETADQVEGAIPAIVVLGVFFVFVLVEGSFHALNAQPAPGGHGDLGDEDFLGGGGGLVFGVEPVELGVELGGLFEGTAGVYGVHDGF